MDGDTRRLPAYARKVTPEAPIENARQEKGLSKEPVPDVCTLDPEGDIVRQLVAMGEAHEDATWPGYHPKL